MSSSAFAVTPTDLSDPTLSIADLVAEIVDTTNLSIVAGSEKAVYLIVGVEVPADPKSIGKFTDGLTTAGTLLIENQDPDAMVPATYVGGLGLSDLDIWTANEGLDRCATRAEGDADGDGDVDVDDFNIWDTTQFTP